MPFHGRLAAGAAIGVAATAIGYWLLRRQTRSGPPDNYIGYLPLDTLKAVADAIWIVDSGPVRSMGLSIPVRMTVVRLRSGDIILHSPTRLTRSLKDEICALGAVRHLVAPSFAHWTFLREWQDAFPDATTWAAPGLADRAQVRRSTIRLDAELGEQAPEAWASELEQGVVPGAGGFHEVYFFHKPSRTLVLCDLLDNLEPAKLPLATRLLAELSGASKGKTPAHVRAILTGRRKKVQAAARRMLAFQPERVIFSHGRWFEDGATERLKQGFGWLL